jgi:outer membrane protein insertion porin family
MKSSAILFWFSLFAVSYSLVNPVIALPKPQTTTPTTETKELVAEISVKSPQGVLSPALQQKVLAVIVSQKGKFTTNKQLQQDIEKIQNLGLFKSIKIKTEAMGQGVRLIYLVEQLGVLRQVQIQSLSVGSTSIILQPDIDKIFGKMYGTNLDNKKLQEQIAVLTKLYQERGYSLAQVVSVDFKNLETQGNINLMVTEGVIEEIKIRFFNRDRQPLPENSREVALLSQLELKPGKIFHVKTMQSDLRRVFNSGRYEDINIKFDLGQKDKTKVIIQINIIEKPTNTR